jgi:hypothetical protein
MCRDEARPLTRERTVAMFLIIWRGWGILTPFLTFLCWLLPLAVIEGAVGHATYSHYSKSLSLVFALLAAGAVWAVGRRLNGDPGRILVDPHTRQQVIVRKRHDLFFLPMQWWAIPIILFGFLQLFTAS